VLFYDLCFLEVAAILVTNIIHIVIDIDVYAIALIVII